MARAVDLIVRYLEAARRARVERSDAAWEELAAFWADDVEIRVADGRGGGEVWRTTARGRSEALRRLSRPEVSGGRLKTITVRTFASADDSVVVVEQVSELTTGAGGSASVPVCHLFELSAGQITRHSIYRNES